MTDSPSSDAPGDGQAQRPQPWFPPGGGYGPGSLPPGQAPAGQPGAEQPGTGQPGLASPGRPAGSARMAGVEPARLRAARFRAARLRPARFRAPGSGSGLRAAAARPVAAVRRGRAQARRDPAPAPGRGRDPGRGLRLHPAQPQSHPGPRRRGHDDLGGHLRHHHPDPAQPGRPQPAHPRPAADAGPGHAPGGPDRRGGGARVRADPAADVHRAGHPGRAARPDHRPGSQRPADQRRGRLAGHPPAAAQPAAGHAAGAAGRARAPADPRPHRGHRLRGRRSSRGLRGRGAAGARGPGPHHLVLDHVQPGHAGRGAGEREPRPGPGPVLEAGGPEFLAGVRHHAAGRDHRGHRGRHPAAPVHLLRRAVGERHRRDRDPGHRHHRGGHRDPADHRRGDGPALRGHADAQGRPGPGVADRVRHRPARQRPARDGQPGGPSGDDFATVWRPPSAGPAPAPGAPPTAAGAPPPW